MSTSSVLHLHMQQWGKFKDKTKTVLSLTSTFLWTLFCQTSVGPSQNVSSGCNCSAESLRLQCKNGSPQACRGDKGLGFADPSRNQIWHTHTLTVLRTMWKAIQGFHGQALRGQRCSKGATNVIFVHLSKKAMKSPLCVYSWQQWQHSVCVLYTSFLGIFRIFCNIYNKMNSIPLLRKEICNKN